MIINGIPIKIGMVIAINRVWKGASAEIAALVPNPTKTENKLPAHVGQPMNKPLNTPNVETIENFFRGWSLNSLTKYTFKAKLKPTSKETTIASIKFKGIIKMENTFVNAIVIIGTYPG